MPTQVLKSLVRRFAGTTLLFSGVVGVGTSGILLASSCIGYLPYSDRPGPGWRSQAHWPTWGEIATYFGFAPWFAYFCLFFGLGLFGLSIVLGFASVPRWLSRILGAILSAAAALLSIASAGWYLALAPIGPDIAGVFGLLYGLFFFPRFVETRSQSVSMWMRVSAVTCSVALFLAWLIWPFLPHKPKAEISYDLVRVTPGDKQVVAASWLGQDLSSDLKTLNLRGETHGGIGSAAGSSPGAPQIYAELIAFQPITAEVKLALPTQGHVVYILKDNKWVAHPDIVNADERALAVQPGTDPRYDGGRVKLTGQPQFFSFTWYPVIPKGL